MPLRFDLSRPPTAANLGLASYKPRSRADARNKSVELLQELKDPGYYKGCTFSNNNAEIDYHIRRAQTLEEDDLAWAQFVGLCGKPDNKVDLACGDDVENGCSDCDRQACPTVLALDEIASTLEGIAQKDKSPTSRFSYSFINARPFCPLVRALFLPGERWACPHWTEREAWLKAAIINIMIWLCGQLGIDFIFIPIGGVTTGMDHLIAKLDKDGITVMVEPLCHAQFFESGQAERAPADLQRLSDDIEEYAVKVGKPQKRRIADAIGMEELKAKAAKYVENLRKGREHATRMKAIKKKPEAQRTSDETKLLAEYESGEHKRKAKRDARAEKTEELDRLRSMPESRRSQEQKAKLEQLEAERNATNERERISYAAKTKELDRLRSMPESRRSQEQKDRLEQLEVKYNAKKERKSAAYAAKTEELDRLRRMPESRRSQEQKDRLEQLEAAKKRKRDYDNDRRAKRKRDAKASQENSTQKPKQKQKRKQNVTLLVSPDLFARAEVEGHSQGERTKLYSQQDATIALNAAVDSAVRDHATRIVIIDPGALQTAIDAGYSEHFVSAMAAKQVASFEEDVLLEAENSVVLAMEKAASKRRKAASGNYNELDRISSMPESHDRFEQREAKGYAKNEKQNDAYATKNEGLDKIRSMAGSQSSQEQKDKLDSDVAAKKRKSEYDKTRKVKKKATAPTTAGKLSSPTATNSGKWSDEEHTLFLQGLEKYRWHPECWSKIATVVKSRTASQVKDHAKAHFKKQHLRHST